VIEPGVRRTTTSSGSRTVATVAEERNTQAAARGAEQCRPTTLDLTIDQHVEADAVAVEAQ
jgi:hypothetical protein